MQYLRAEVGGTGNPTYVHWSTWGNTNAGGMKLGDYEIYVPLTPTVIIPGNIEEKIRQIDEYF